MVARHQGGSFLFEQINPADVVAEEFGASAPFSVT